MVVINIAIRQYKVTDIGVYHIVINQKVFVQTHFWPFDQRKPCLVNGKPAAVDLEAPEAHVWRVHVKVYTVHTIIVLLYYRGIKSRIGTLDHYFVTDYYFPHYLASFAKYFAFCYTF